VFTLTVPSCPTTSQLAVYLSLPSAVFDACYISVVFLATHFTSCRVPVDVKAAFLRRSMTVMVVLMIRRMNLFTPFCGNADHDTLHVNRHQERSCPPQIHYNTFHVALLAVTTRPKHQVTRLLSLYPCGEPGSKTREHMHSFSCRLWVSNSPPIASHTRLEAHCFVGTLTYYSLLPSHSICSTD